MLAGSEFQIFGAEIRKAREQKTDVLTTESRRQLVAMLSGAQ